MSVAITIRDVPDDVRNTLASRAALHGQSLQQFLRSELTELAGRPDLRAWRQAVRQEAVAFGSPVTSAEITAAVRQSRDERS